MSQKKNIQSIRLKGVRQNNLKGFDLDIPLGKLIVVTGLSGTGKSSLVFETLHAEGQRRYVETFSPYTRQFLEIMDRPQVDTIENIRPSIAIQQTNTVKTSRSTVGTMTELCDYFKVWFCHVSELFDPDTGKKIEHDSPQTIWKKTLHLWPDATVTIAFQVEKPDSFTWEEIINSLTKQGYSKAILHLGIKDLDQLTNTELNKIASLFIVQDRLGIDKENHSRFIESVTTALHFGEGEVTLFSQEGNPLANFSEHLHSKTSGKHFTPPTPANFSFNSPIGACPVCKGFGRVVEIDYNLVIPNHNLSIEQGAIRPFHGDVFKECLKDLLKAAKKLNIRTNVPWNSLTEKEKNLIIQGEPAYKNNGRHPPKTWYGIKGFFDWLDTKRYKMHLRVLAAKYRSYTTCPSCKGSRLKPEALLWKWKNKTLPELYAMSIQDLLELMKLYHKKNDNPATELAVHSIITRLDYLVQVGLGYLTLDRTSRTLSGGEVERVNLTTCLGTSLVETLFILDEPSVGLHSRDIHQLVQVLRRLTSLGNTVVVVEHDESIMQAADQIIEIGPEPGSRGGNIVFQGSVTAIQKDKKSKTGAYLSGALKIETPKKRRSCTIKPLPYVLEFKQVSKNNLKNVDIKIPLNRFVCLAGVSGSGKSTLMNNVIYQGLLTEQGKMTEDPAIIESIVFKNPQQKNIESKNERQKTTKSNIYISEVVLVDQSPLTKTPRSNPALYVETWDAIRQLFAQTKQALSSGMTASHFSFNSGNGRCDHCQGLGYEQVEMQFLSDVFVTCPVCEGSRFKQEVLAIKWKNKSITDILKLDIRQARELFWEYPKITHKLDALITIGLDYLTLGQPLNTLSGGESQRLKLVKYFTRLDAHQTPTLLLLDEPTTGLHRDDVKRLIFVLQKLVEQGHSLVVIEHQLDVLKSADWIIELGPGAGSNGGKIVAEGTPETIAAQSTETARFLNPALKSSTASSKARLPAIIESNIQPLNTVTLKGAREHNLKNISVTIPHNEITVLTGISGSGKSTLAFDIIFAEGQRRFMESISAYARQFIEQMPKPNIDQLTGIPPTVAIEQRVTRGTFKSTVATVTEVAQYLRLLYARIGIQYSPKTDAPVIPLSPHALFNNLEQILDLKHNQSAEHLYLCAPVIQSRKGHHEPVANWARSHGYSLLRVDGKIIPVENFKRLDRYKEHDIEIILADFGKHSKPEKLSERRTLFEQALQLGNGACFIVIPNHPSKLHWFSTQRTDPATGEAFPELDPKHFSWNSSKGWCPTCKGHGRIYEWITQSDQPPVWYTEESHGKPCPDCHGGRLNRVSSAVKLHLKDGKNISLPQLLQNTAPDLIQILKTLKLDKRSQEIVKDLIPQIHERLDFMEKVGLGYLTLNRSSNTLSGGEAQRIRLAAQLSSNLSGVLYVLDEPSIGLHVRDTHRLLESLQALKNKGNTLLVVEHDDDTMRQADHIIDLGPAAGVHGGEVLAEGPMASILKNDRSLTGRYLKHGITHPLQGFYREIPPLKKQPAKTFDEKWATITKTALRNLKKDTLYLPLQKLIVVCGISGAGKSTLIRDLLRPTIQFAIEKKSNHITANDYLRHPFISVDNPKEQLPFEDCFNGNSFKKVIEIDQEPIGKTSRSTPATYIGAFDIIRTFFASLPEAKIHGCTTSHFSFNTKDGRCENCHGNGKTKLEMNFLPDTYVTCEACNGGRYGPELSDIRWNGKNIGDVLNLTFEEAAEFFGFHSRLKSLMDLMVQTGLGYLKLGQPSPTLSGGEAQRLKLVSELAAGLPTFKEKKRGILPTNLYILEEPTIGLHLSDCERLIHLLHQLVNQGHTVVVIEHHLDIIAEADYVVEVGPEGGEAGGHILYQGTLSGFLQNKESPTTPFLKKHLALNK